MALLFSDGFDHYAITDLTRMWTQAYGGVGSGRFAISSGGGARGTNALKITSVISTDYEALGRSLTPATTTCCLGFRFRGNSWSDLLTVASGGNTLNIVSANQGALDHRINILAAVRKDYYTHVGLVINANGSISLYRGDANSLSGAGPLVGQDRIAATIGTTDEALSEDIDHYIELKVVVHASSGSVLLRVNGDTWFSASSINTKASGVDAQTAWNEIVIGSHLANTDTNDWYFEDLYCADSDTSDAYNQVADLVGDVAINYANVFEDGTNTDWTPSTGSDHFAMVDDNPPDLDSTYNSTTTVNAIDTFNKTAVPITGIGVVALVPIYLRRRTEGAGTTTAAVIRDDGTEYSGSKAGTALAEGDPGNYSYNWWSVTQRPSNSATALTQALVDAMEIGYEKVT